MGGGVSDGVSGGSGSIVTSQLNFDPVFRYLFHRYRVLPQLRPKTCAAVTSSRRKALRTVLRAIRTNSRINNY